MRASQRSRRRSRIASATPRPPATTSVSMRPRTSPIEPSGTSFTPAEHTIGLAPLVRISVV